MSEYINIPITIRSDEKGYFDRECPNSECLYTFKINLKEWEEKVSGNEMHCPMCGHIASSDQWWTQEQIEERNKIAKNFAKYYASSMLDNMFKKLARSCKTLKITYKPGRKISFHNSPIGQREEWENEITCENCGTQFSVIGAAYFCPCCGHNSVDRTFEDSIDRITKMLDSIPLMRQMLEKNNSKDDAENICRALLERSIGDIVSAFQKFACCRYETVTGKSARVNDFQIVEKGSQLFFSACNKKYSDWLSECELAAMHLLFQRRHILEHNGGIVDAKYLQNSGDNTYVEGQRIIVKESDARELLIIVQKLFVGLRTLEKSEKRTER